MSASNGSSTAEQHYHQTLSSDARRTIRTIPELKRESSRETLAAVNLLHALDIDDRPSFAIQTQPAPSYDAGVSLELVYYNNALANTDGLLARVTGQPDGTSVFYEHDSQHAFRRWSLGVGDENDFARRGNAYMFDGLIWTAVVVEGHKIVSGLHASLLWPEIGPRKHHQNHVQPQHMPVQGRAPTVPPDPSPQPTASGYTPPSLGTTYGPFDVTLPEPPESILSEHIKHFRAVDWANTPLGAMPSWPPELRTTVNMCLNDIHPCMVFWGDDVIMIYNAAYVQLIGVMHPYAMGCSAREVASDYWPTFQPLIDRINITGQSVCDNEVPIFIDRLGFLEETYWTFQFIPIIDGKGLIAGYYHPLFETTKNSLLERRVSSLVELGTKTAKARTLPSYWDLATDTLKLNAKDVPFALLYAVDSQHGSDVGSVSSPGSLPPIETYLLKGSIGVERDHAIAPSCIDVQQGAHILQPFFTQAIKSKKATIINLEELALSDADLQSIDWKGYGEPCRTIVVCPLALTTGDQVEGFLVLGTNPRRPFDETYQQFVHVMLRLLATSLASVVLFEEEVRQNEKAIGQASAMQEQLLTELQTKEKRFQRFAERADVAIFIMDASGKYTYRNQRWYDIFEVAATDDDVMSAWLKIAFPEDIAKCEGVFARLVMHKEAVSFELRTKMPWLPPPDVSRPESESVEHFRWILCSAYPELGANGELVEIVGNVTDISKQKWAEDIQKIRTDSALEAKQHLEHFIDTTSHEMRNPLSAIMQSADGILAAYNFDNDTHSPPSPFAWYSFLEQTIDAAQTIAQCTQHMRHIVDDILTISKLDSGLLVITPVDAQPESLVKHAVKMFEAEAKASYVELSFTIDQSYRDMELSFVSLDPTRLLQILINLLTNAIKFTRLEKTRRVSIVLSASMMMPKSSAEGIQFIEEKLVEEDRHLKDDWKQAEDIVFLQFNITDTGRGLSEDERASLFTRFSQASPRTHIHYGGSGLGLFISRRLTELQGGAIGLSSEPKKGSTFSFYIKARRVKPAMRRKGSSLSILPEDIRHRPGTPLTHMPRPSPPIRIPSYLTDDGNSAQPPSPRLLRQPPYQRRPPATSTGCSPDHAELSALQDIAEAKTTTSTSKPMHVLVVEDNLVNQRVLAKQLRNLGCIVSVANHGREAVEFMERTVRWNRAATSAQPIACRYSYHIPCTEPPPMSHCEEPEIPIELHVVLMDWEMPTMNGLEAVTQIRLLEQSGALKGRLPVICVTANVRQQQIQKAMEAGMDDVVGKPFRVAELMVRMKDVAEAVAHGQKAIGLGITTEL
ncbi:putative histidine kinase HHK11p [Ampelomyces quisqualis]|uniref:Putative histidine kinase HHK11p n=1 Tax=Ampelomyces quisqualis TaxID=50730 RepID=A0A6A5QQL2_AMPQU|nr:putative histidine kinase HHK11p [Ampelomyces quisqualis]